MKRHEDRRNEILDTAQALFYRLGYDRTTIAHLIDAVGVAKGTFYHYFTSKEQLLDELLDRGYRELGPMLQRIAEDSERSAVERINEMFRVGNRWKADNRALIIETTRVVFRDENIRLRQKNDEKAIETFAPVFSRIVEQGVRQGVFDTPHPRDAGEVIFLLSRSMGEVIARLFLQAVEDPRHLEELIHKLDVYERATERIIGAPKDSIKLTDEVELRRLVGAEQNHTEVDS